ncbi:MAG: isocitrate/isopropylmalate family dehydrogenase, partial [Polyangiales bacterium]
EPVHGSAPDIEGKDLANPLATVLSIALMLGHLGYVAEEKRLEAIVEKALAAGACTRDVGGSMGTRAVGEWIVAELHKQLTG